VKLRKEGVEEEEEEEEEKSAALDKAANSLDAVRRSLPFCRERNGFGRID
jgi:hypothetical protein